MGFPLALKGEADFGGMLYGWSVAGQTGLHRISATSWTGERPPGRGLANVLSLAASPDADGPLLAGTTAGLVMSRDGGDTWSPVTGIPADSPVTAASCHTSDSRRVYAHVARPDRGFMRSRDGGATWESTGFVGDARTPVIAIADGPGEHVALAITDSETLPKIEGEYITPGKVRRARLQPGREGPVGSADQGGGIRRRRRACTGVQRARNRLRGNRGEDLMSRIGVVVLTAIFVSLGAAEIHAQTARGHGDHGTPEAWKLAWPAGSPVKGREVFVKLECYSCHEVKGETFPAPTDKQKVGPELSMMGPLHEAEYFVEAIVNPSATIEKGKGYEAADGSSKMPSYNDSIAVQELIDLVAYLRGLKPPAESPAGHGGTSGSPGGHDKH